MKTRRLRICSAALSLSVLLSLMPAAMAGETAAAEQVSTAPASAVWDGLADTDWYTGHENDTAFTISTPAQLAGLAQLVNSGTGFSGKTITLGADIDLGNAEWTPIGKSGAAFQGTFDGVGYTIANLRVDTPTQAYAGLFGSCSSPAKLQNFTLQNVAVTGANQTAAVLGGSTASSTTIKGVRVTGSIQIGGKWFVGAILGQGYGAVQNCSVQGDGTTASYVTATGGYAGGIVGFMGEDGNVTSGCTVKDITVSGAGYGVGGINGILHYGNTIKDCTVENVVVWQTEGPDENGRIYCGAFGGTYLGDNGNTPPTLRDCTFVGRLLSGADQTDVTEPTRYVGSLWYGSMPPATVNVENCTVSAPVVPVAQVGGQQFGTLPAAIDAAQQGSDKTITLLSDITVHTWDMAWNMQGITLNGAGHTLAVDQIESGQNHDAVFHSAGGNTFRDLTVDLSGVTEASLAQGSRAFAAAPGDRFLNVTIKGSDKVAYGITVGGTNAADETVTIDGCTFVSLTHAIYDSEKGTVENLIIQDSDFTGCERIVILRAENGRFTGNQVSGGKLNILGAAQTVTGNTFADTSRISFYKDGAVFTGNAVSTGSYLELTEQDGLSRDLTGNDFGEQLILTTEITQAAVTLPAPVKEGYAFAGWDDGEKTYPAGSVYPLTANVTLTAQWTAQPDDDNKPGGGSSGSNSGGSSSGGSASAGDKTETTTHPDGSTTTTVTKPDGSKTETTQKPDGSQQVVETGKDGTTTTTTTDTDGNQTATTAKPDGSSTTTVTQTNGASSTTTVDQSGKSETDVQLPSAVVGDAAEKGETVALPMPSVPASNDAAAAPTVTVGLSGSTSAKVEIPVQDVTPGTVAVLVQPDGTEQIIKTSLTTENGVSVTLNDGDTVKLIDNTKVFEDVADDHWGSDAVTFASSRELFSGTSETTFEPETAMNRAMIVTVLARLDGVDTGSGAAWYEAGRQWAMDHKVSDGSNMQEELTREQLAAMLYRYAGEPAVSGSMTAFSDAQQVSAYAQQAMAWAVENGLIAGTTATTLDPQGQATRAQVAAILQRYISVMA